MGQNALICVLPENRMCMSLHRCDTIILDLHNLLPTIGVKLPEPLLMQLRTSGFLNILSQRQITNNRCTSSTRHYKYDASHSTVKTYSYHSSMLLYDGHILLRYGAQPQSTASALLLLLLPALLLVGEVHRDADVFTHVKNPQDARQDDEH